MKRFIFALITFSVFTSASLAQDDKMDAKIIDRWQHIKEIDPFTDEELEYAIVLEESSRKFVHVMCKNRNYFEFKVSANVYIGDDANRDNLLYRIDKKEAQKVTLKGYKSNLYANDLENLFIKHLMEGGDTLIVRATGYDFDTGTAQFAMKGAAEAVSSVVKACSK